MTNKELYENIIALYKNCSEKEYGFHLHHIYPKSIWPDEKDMPENHVYVPAIVHWYLHVLLNRAFIEMGKPEYAEKLKTCPNGIAEFINKDRDKFQCIDFEHKSAQIEEYLQHVLLPSAANLEIDNKRKNARAKEIAKKINAIIICGGTQDNTKCNGEKIINGEFGGYIELMTPNEIKEMAKTEKLLLCRSTTDKRAKKLGIVDIPRKDYGAICYRLRHHYDTSPLTYNLTKRITELYCVERTLPKLFDVSKSLEDINAAFIIENIDQLDKELNDLERK